MNQSTTKCQVEHYFGALFLREHYKSRTPPWCPGPCPACRAENRHVPNLFPHLSKSPTCPSTIYLLGRGRWVPSARRREQLGAGCLSPTVALCFSVQPHSTAACHLVQTTGNNTSVQLEETRFSLCQENDLRCQITLQLPEKDLSVQIH